MSLLDSLVANALPWTPKFVVGRVARRYIAGETLEDAVRVIRSLNEQHVAATVDVLGEFITDFAEAERTAAEYRRVLDAIEREHLKANASVKLTAFGLGIDPSRCLELVRGLATQAAAHRSFLRIDMENTPYTDATLGIVRTLRRAGLPVGAVLQAYLRRTAADAASLAAEGIPVRLCKGIYRESPEHAFQDREEIRDSYRRCLRILLGGPARVAVATHDDVLVEDAYEAIRAMAVPPSRYEFQMLLGVRERLRREIVAKGHAMRVYVPFGRAWYGYSLRRLRENPAIAGHVVRSMLGRS